MRLVVEEAATIAAVGVVLERVDVLATVVLVKHGLSVDVRVVGGVEGRRVPGKVTIRWRYWVRVVRQSLRFLRSTEILVFNVAVDLQKAIASRCTLSTWTKCLNNIT